MSKLDLLDFPDATQTLNETRQSRNEQQEKLIQDFLIKKVLVAINEAKAKFLFGCELVIDEKITDLDAIKSFLTSKNYGVSIESKNNDKISAQQGWEYLETILKISWNKNNE